MKDQKVSTALGAAILIIIAATVAGFVLLCFKNYPVKDDIRSVVVSEQRVDTSNWREFKSETYGF